MPLKNDYELFMFDTVPILTREFDAQCSCFGSGWELSPYGTFYPCPIHYENQPRPDDLIEDGMEF